jgi:hypothetical protein
MTSLPPALVAGLVGATLSTIAIQAHAQAAPAASAASAPVDDARRGILTRNPELRVSKVDQDRIAVHRIDIVDDHGVIRATLGAPTPAPIIDGIQYKRVFPVAGLVLFDRDGNERGGYGVADIDGTAVVAAEDHANGDAIGWRIMPDGSVTFLINQRGAMKRDALDNRLIPAADSPTRVKMTVAADGTPAIALQDKESRPRLRLTVTPEGYGAIEFLDAQGRAVQTFAPEALKGSTK